MSRGDKVDDSGPEGPDRFEVNLRLLISTTHNHVSRYHSQWVHELYEQKK